MAISFQFSKLNLFIMYISLLIKPTIIYKIIQMQFEKLKMSLLPPAFGFRNSGVTCYFNALVQSLLSCTSLTNVFLTNRNNPIFLENPVANVYLRMVLYMEQIRLHKANVLNDMNRVSLAEQSLQLWHAMVMYVRKNFQHDHFGRGQEDSTEGFVILLRCWEKIPEINILFDHAYHGNCECFKCGAKKFTFDQMNDREYDGLKEKMENKVDDASTKDVHWVDFNNHFDVPITFRDEENDKIEKLLGSLPKPTLKNYLIRRRSMIDDGYKCFNCKQTGDKVQTLNLATIPEILVVLIKKYKFNRRTKQNMKVSIDVKIPSKLIFEMQDGKTVKVYNIVSQIIHSGGANRAHYWSNSIRVNSHTSNIGSNGDTCKYRWFKLDDRSYRPINGCVTQPDTYVVFYHYIKDMIVSR